MYASKLFTKSALTAALITALIPAANAATDAEVDALRNEVAQLRAMIMQQQHNLAPMHAMPAGQPPAAPAKGFKMNTASGAEVELYGTLRADAAYVLEGNDNYTSNIPGVGAPGTAGNTEDKLNTSVQSTRFGLNFKSDTKDANKLGGKLEVDFVNGANNSDGSLRIRHAYLTYNDWLAGQTKSTFLGHSPEILDAGTNVGTGFKRVPMVRYQHNLMPDTQVMVGLEQGKSAGNSTNAKYQLPTLVARVNQNFAGKQGVASLRGLVESYDAERPGTAAVAPINVLAADGTTIVGTIPGKAATAGATDSMTGYGIGAGVNYKFNKMFEGFADVNYVKGNSGLVHGTTNAYAFNGDDAEANEALSWMVGGAFNINPKLRSTIGYSEVNFDDSSDYAKIASIATGTGAASNEKLHSIFANLIYSPVKQVDLGVEYHDGQRETFNGTKFDDDRVSVTAAYKF